MDIQIIFNKGECQMIKYFVSYHVTINNSIGFGNCFLTRKKPIEGHEDIQSITKEIAEFNKMENGEFVVLNFQEIKERG